MGAMRFLVPRRERMAADAVERATFSGMDEIPWHTRTQWTDQGLVVERAESDSGNFNFAASIGILSNTSGAAYEGLQITGWPIATMLRGRFVVREGKLVGDKSYGRYLSRGKPLEPSAMPAK